MNSKYYLLNLKTGTWTEDLSERGQKSLEELVVKFTIY
jgi:hypothetical protein